MKLTAHILDQRQQWVAAHPILFAALDLGRDEVLQRKGMAAQPGRGCLVQHLAGRALVDDLEVVGQPHQRRPLAHDVVGQAVQGAHPVAHVRQQALRLDQLADPLVEAVHSRVDQRDDQHLLPAVQHAAIDDLRGQLR